MDSLVMTAGERSVRRAVRAVGGAGHDGNLRMYLYRRAKRVIGGTAQAQRNPVATRPLGSPAR